jgi:hypothetical protein
VRSQQRRRPRVVAGGDVARHRLIDESALVPCLWRAMRARSVRAVCCACHVLSPSPVAACNPIRRGDCLSCDVQSRLGREQSQLAVHRQCTLRSASQPRNVR